MTFRQRKTPEPSSPSLPTLGLSWGDVYALVSVFGDIHASGWSSPHCGGREFYVDLGELSERCREVSGGDFFIEIESLPAK